MRFPVVLVLFLVAVMFAAGACAQGVLDTCHVRSSYDVTIAPDAVVFDRAQPAPERVRMHDGTLQVDGTPVVLDAADHGRIVRFEQITRALEPRVKAIADQAVDLAASVVRRQAGEPATGSALDVHLNDRAREIRARIARSHSTHDWQGQAFQDEVDRTIADIMPLLVHGLLQQAMTAAVEGDLGAASDLRDRALHLGADLQARMQQRLEVLRPRVRALCPSLHALDVLESGFSTPLPGGVRLDLIEPD